MKKIGLLCLALVLALGTLGAGFAYWSETLDIGQNQVDTGDLDVEYTVLPSKMDFPRCIYPSPYVPCRNFQPDPWDNTAHYDTGHTYADTFRITGDPHLMWINLENMYPGAECQIIFGIQNKGTIPAKMTGCTITRTGSSDDLWNDMQGRVHAIMRNGAGTRVNMWPDQPGAYAHTGWQTLDDLGDAIVNAFDGVVLQPNYYFEFDVPEEDGCMHLRLVSSSSNDTEETNIAFTVEFTFEPFNK